MDAAFVRMVKTFGVLETMALMRRMDVTFMRTMKTMMRTVRRMSMKMPRRTLVLIHMDGSGTHVIRCQKHRYCFAQIQRQRPLSFSFLSHKAVITRSRSWSGNDDLKSSDSGRPGRIFRLHGKRVSTRSIRNAG